MPSHCRGQIDPNSTASPILDEDLALDFWSGLRLLARHARDRAGGTATVRATIVPLLLGPAARGGQALLPRDVEVRPDHG